MENFPQRLSQSPQASVPADSEQASAHVSSAVPPTERWFLLRLCLWSVILTGLGMLMGQALCPPLTDQAVRALISAHLPAADTSFFTVFVRLLLPCLPGYILLALSAMTGFSRPVIWGILSLQSVAEGFSLSFLLLLSREHWHISPLPPRHLAQGFAVKALLLLIIRLALSYDTRYTARRYLHLIPSAHSLRSLLIRHLALSLICFVCVLLITAGYALFLFSPV